MNNENILKLKKERKDGNHLWEIDSKLFDKKIEEYKRKIDNADYKFEDTILNLGLIALRLKEDKEEKYKIAGEIIYNQMYGHLEKENENEWIRKSIRTIKY